MATRQRLRLLKNAWPTSLFGGQRYFPLNIDIAFRQINDPYWFHLIWDITNSVFTVLFIRSDVPYSELQLYVRSLKSKDSNYIRIFYFPIRMGYIVACDSSNNMLHISTSYISDDSDRIHLYCNKNIFRYFSHTIYPIFFLVLDTRTNSVASFT